MEALEQISREFSCCCDDCAIKMSYGLSKFKVNQGALPPYRTSSDRDLIFCEMPPYSELYSLSAREFAPKYPSLRTPQL